MHAPKEKKHERVNLVSAKNCILAFGLAPSSSVGSNKWRSQGQIFLLNMSGGFVNFIFIIIASQWDSFFQDSFYA